MQITSESTFIASPLAIMKVSGQCRWNGMQLRSLQCNDTAVSGHTTPPIACKHADGIHCYSHVAEHRKKLAALLQMRTSEYHGTQLPICTLLTQTAFSFVRMSKPYGWAVCCTQGCFIGHVMNIFVIVFCALKIEILLAHQYQHVWQQSSGSPSIYCIGL